MCCKDKELRRGTKRFKLELPFLYLMNKNSIMRMERGLPPLLLSRNGKRGLSPLNFALLKSNRRGSSLQSIKIFILISMNEDNRTSMLLKFAVTFFYKLGFKSSLQTIVL